MLFTEFVSVNRLEAAEEDVELLAVLLPAGSLLTVVELLAIVLPILLLLLPAFVLLITLFAGRSSSPTCLLLLADKLLLIESLFAADSLTVV